MKRVDLAQAIQLLANVGVIAGIVFLALELQQNNSLLEAQAGYNLARNRVENNDLLKSSPEFAELMVKLADGRDLSEQDQWQAHGFYQSFLVTFSWEYGEYSAGRLSRD